MNNAAKKSDADIVNLQKQSSDLHKELQQKIQARHAEIVSDVESLRDSIKAKKQEIADISAADVPLETARSRLVDDIRHRAEQVEFDQRFDWLWSPTANPPTLLFGAAPREEDYGRKYTGYHRDEMTARLSEFENQIVDVNAEIVAMKRSLDAALCRLLEDQILARFDTLDHSAKSPGLPLEKRPKVISKLEDEINRLEMIEEALIVESRELGIPIERREDASPVVILEWRD